MSEGAWGSKHLLLLSGPMGCGHIRAAAALEACARERYPGLKVTSINVQEFMPTWLRKIFTDYYIAMLNRMPFVWSYVYNKLDSPPNQSMLGKFTAMLRYRIKKRMMRRIAELKPDFIVCTHFLPAEILGRAKRMKQIDIPVSVVVTDFSLHWVYVQHHLDNFFVNCHEVAFRLNNRGIPREKIYITGCPIFPEFARAYTPHDILKIKEEFGMPAKRTLVLTMMGGESVGRLEEISHIVLKHFQNAGVIALAGRSKQAYDRLAHLKEKYPDRMFPVAYTSRVADYLAVSDCVITKPGGLSISECLAMRKPIIIMDPIPGQEERNAAYLVERAVVARADDELSLLYKDVLFSSDMMQMVSRQMIQFSRPYAGYDILAVAVEGKDNCRYV